MPQVVIGDGARDHRLTNRHGAYANAWIVASLGADFGGIAFAVYPDSVPHILRYDTGLRDGLGNELEAVSPNLREAFRGK